MQKQFIVGDVLEKNWSHMDEFFVKCSWFTNSLIQYFKCLFKKLSKSCIAPF